MMALLTEPTETCDLCLGDARWEYTGDLLHDQVRWCCSRHHELLSTSVDREPSHWRRVS